MIRMNCRDLLGKLLLCAGLLVATASASFAQSADNVGGSSFGNFGAGGAYGDFDMQAQAATWNPAAAAAVSNSAGATGAYGNTGYRTNEAPQQQTYGDSQRTGQQLASRNGMGTLQLPLTQMTQLDKVYGRGRGLPPTRLDSFVMNAAGSADMIYGDEGSEGIPPFFGFDDSHYIGTGIQSGGLTTGHRSGLPSAWGYPQ
jgi:hypothetical protein